MFLDLFENRHKFLNLSTASAALSLLSFMSTTLFCRAKRLTTSYDNGWGTGGMKDKDKRDKILFFQRE